MQLNNQEHYEDLKTRFMEIFFQRVSSKIIHFSFQTTIAFSNFIGQFLILYFCPFFFDYSVMSQTWTLNFVKIVIFRPFSTIVTCRISRKRKYQNKTNNILQIILFCFVHQIILIASISFSLDPNQGVGNSFKALITKPLHSQKRNQMELKITFILIPKKFNILIKNKTKKVDFYGMKLSPSFHLHKCFVGLKKNSKNLEEDLNC
ncbi:hypothetical protein BpHYR1_019045 [Brachionus plicatilis]|uniref:Transmembrane protein n=1 Tax=Brachionus plicatilis TaxID=10195 RepID=A0A3M7P5I9_BRAPC|nr:hypothetical protein BpHYR1_019045 [Brachionus plicatilis]